MKVSKKYLDYLYSIRFSVKTRISKELERLDAERQKLSKGFAFLFMNSCVDFLR